MERDPRIVGGFDWMISCTTEFEATIAFVQDVLGLTIAKQGPAQTDTHFSRYACVTLPNGGTLEIAEPAQSAGPLQGKQILCLAVPDLVQARADLDRRGAVFVSDMFDDGTGVGWIYLQAPGGNIYQIYGPVKSAVA
jgi:catechol 2,3-dioxygenase-like lactoylglutathione lyase family enzyme